ncbi:MAG: phosphatidate cytidylyltransferase [Shimia sp.]|uniref:phosphatidate cytidylyltransferase n=1 Tax=Shimia sp. TaxID=1954381 RepID=UPI0040587A56
MSLNADKWSDLRARVLSALVLVLVGAAAIWLGGFWFHLWVAVIGGGMMWELTRLMGGGPKVAVPVGALAAAALLAVPYLPWEVKVPALVAVAIAGGSQIHKDRMIFIAYAALLMLACFGLDVLRDVRGTYWVLWLVTVVMATDVAGYFAGRLLGGPKFWPKVSPKKTWSGTAAGWVAAGFVGLAFGGWPLVVLSVLTSFASQMGDVAESAIKRRAGVKDSSNLIPGHGGLLDRFDAMMAAAVFVLLLGAILGLPAI